MRTLFPTLHDWIACEAVSFDHRSRDSLGKAIDRILSHSTNLALLAFGEPLHGDENFLHLRNHIFQHLVEHQGYTAIAIESGFPQSHLVNDFVQHRNSASIDDVLRNGFTHGFGNSPATRELIEWIRTFNASRDNPISFYGFDAPMEMSGADSPRQMLANVLDLLDRVDESKNDDRRTRITALLGNEADWSNPAAMMDPGKSIGLSPAATQLRIETADLISELLRRRPEVITKTSRQDFQQAMQHASQARLQLDYHSVYAQQSPTRIADLLGIRDAMMAENLMYTIERERGKVFAFAHNSHLKRGIAEWQLGSHALRWWSAGAHMHHLLGNRYSMIGGGVGAGAEPNSLEAIIFSTAGPSRLIPTHLGAGLPVTKIARLQPRSASSMNPTYFPFTANSPTDFDWLLLPE